MFSFECFLSLDAGGQRQTMWLFEWDNSFTLTSMLGISATLVHVPCQCTVTHVFHHPKKNVQSANSCLVLFLSKRLCIPKKCSPRPPWRDMIFHDFCWPRIVPGALLVLGGVFMPGSPRYLVAQGTNRIWSVGEVLTWWGWGLWKMWLDTWMVLMDKI